MPLLPKEESNILKAQIFDLSEKGAKEALFGMVEILKHHPSILMNVFRLIIEDATKYTNVIKARSLRV